MWEPADYVRGCLFLLGFIRDCGMNAIHPDTYVPLLIWISIAFMESLTLLLV